MFQSQAKTGPVDKDVENHKDNQAMQVIDITEKKQFTPFNNQIIKETHKEIPKELEWSSHS